MQPHAPSTGDQIFGPQHVPAIVRLLCTVAIVLCLTVSQYALYAAGIAYEVKGGNPIVKIHPASWIILAAFAIFFLYRACGAARLRAWVVERAGLLAYSLICILVTLYKGSTDGLSGLALPVDSFLVPSLLVLMLADMPSAYRQRLVSLIVALAVLNALIGIAEVRLHARIFPYELHGMPMQEAYFRATALNGHPLRNAMLTACALLALLGRPWSFAVRFACFIALGMGLLAFSGRTATFIGLCGFVFLFGRLFNQYVRASRKAFMFAVWAAMVLGSVTASGASAVLMTTKFGARILNGDINDESAAVRVHLLALFDKIDLTDLFFGYSFDDIDQLTIASHLPAIECFWVFMTLYLGIIAFTPWVLALLYEVVYIVRRTDLAGRAILVCVLLIASTSVSLSSKDTLLNIVFALAMGTGGADFTPRARGA